MKSSILTAFAVALGLMLLMAQSTFAHAKLDHCTPELFKNVTTNPSAVRCTFTEALVLGQSSLAVFNSNSERVDNNDPKLDPSDDSKMTLVVTLNSAKLGNGVYKVDWVSVSAYDGDRADGEWFFGIGANTVLPPPDPTFKDLPEGKGGVFVRNFYGKRLTFTINGVEYEIPANSKQLIVLDPDTYNYSANVFGDDDTEVMDAVDVEEGSISTLSFCTGCD